MKPFKIREPMNPFKMFVLAVCLLPLVGCGPGVGTLSGKVTHEGRPLNAGTVQVVHPDGTSYTGAIQPDGTFTIPNIPEGKVTIGVSNPHPMAQYQELAGFAKTDAQRNALKKPTTEEVRAWIGIPSTYANPDTSGLSVQIKKGTINKDLPLTGLPESIPTPGAATPGLTPRAKGGK